MASLTQWRWVWVSSGSWWWTERPGVLQSLGAKSQTRLNDWTELNWTELAHAWAQKAVHESSVLQLGMLGLHLLYHLLAGGADLGATGEGHVLQTLILAAHSTEATAAAAGPHLLTTQARTWPGRRYGGPHDYTAPADRPFSRGICRRSSRHPHSRVGVLQGCGSADWCVQKLPLVRVSCIWWFHKGWELHQLQPSNGQSLSLPDWGWWGRQSKARGERA